MLLGAIADDLTGATDLCLTLSREGMRTVQVIGVPPEGFDFSGFDAVVVALKSRTIPVEEAVALSLAAADRLRAGGAEQIIFKYCSTFDSTPAGNIGQVTEALMAHLDVRLTIVCPAFPANGRTVYRGHLFVGDLLLSDSPMKNHPLTPMTDASLLRTLAHQTALSIGLVPFGIVDQGAAAIAAAFSDAQARGERILVVDALTDTHLREIGKAAEGLALITGGSGIAIGLPANFVRAGRLDAKRPDATFAAGAGRAVILAGSCSSATLRQIEAAKSAGIPALGIDPLDIDSGETTPATVAQWIMAQSHATPLVYTSAAPDAVRAAQETLGREQAGAMVEELLARTAILLRDAGYSRFIVAGGETSGAVVQALGVSALEIGPEIDPGVPWTRSIGAGPPVTLALKSGNFGADDFFLKAWALLS